jgi:hypothetical protein
MSVDRERRQQTVACVLPAQQGIVAESSEMWFCVQREMKKQPLTRST